MSDLKIEISKSICILKGNETLNSLYDARLRYMDEAIEYKMSEKSFWTKKLKYTTKEAARDALKSSKDYIGFWDNQEQAILNYGLSKEKEIKSVLAMLHMHERPTIEIDRKTFKLLGFDDE